MKRPGKTQGLRHIALFVPDLVAAEHFFVDLMGMTIEWRPDPDNVYLTSGNDNLALHQVETVDGQGSLDHIGFFINDPDEVQAWFEFLKASILNNNVDLIGTLKRKQVLQHLLNSQMILLPINKAANAKGRIPGKLFECLRARRPILCLGPIEADTSWIVEKTLSGKSFDYSDVKNVKHYILDRYNKYLNGSNHIENENIEQYRNDLQTEKVANILNQITNNNNIKTR